MLSESLCCVPTVGGEIALVFWSNIWTNCIYCALPVCSVNARPLTVNIKLAGTGVSQQMSTRHMKTHGGRLKEDDRFLPALRGPSLQQGVGVEERGKANVWIKRHGAKILDLVASVCFLLISNSVGLHVRLTKVLRSPLPRLGAEVSVIWQRGSYLFFYPGEQSVIVLTVPLLLWHFH